LSGLFDILPAEAGSFSVLQPLRLHHTEFWALLKERMESLRRNNMTVIIGEMSFHIERAAIGKVRYTFRGGGGCSSSAETGSRSDHRREGGLSDRSNIRG